MKLRLALLLAAAALAGCGGGAAGEGGTASLWITRDRGQTVLLERSVPAGLTAMQVLDREADVRTRYGGRFVQSINGIEGSLTARRDWFYFVNGIEADRSAAEYRVRPGDIVWWDLRSWRGAMSVPVVVGAFPEPFLHGFGGERHTTVVLADTPRALPAARALARIVRGVVRGALPRGPANVLEVTADGVLFSATGRGPGSPVVFRIGVSDARRLARNPALARFRYEGLP